MNCGGFRSALLSTKVETTIKVQILTGEQTKPRPYLHEVL
jgi:hypothetical protein